jgi:hypothetical protein
VKFPSRSDSIDASKPGYLSKTEKYTCDNKWKVIERVEKLKGDHPLLNEIVKKALPFLPSPFDKISQAIYNGLESSKEER